MEKTFMTEKLKIEDLTPVGFSIDMVAKLYFYKGRIFRAINKAFEKDVQEMFDSGMMEELISEDLFVNSWITDVEIEGFNLVIEHQKIENWNYPYEWSPAMLKDAAINVLQVNTIANKYNFELFDVHSFNVVFDKSTPKYVDLGSLFKRDPNNGKCWSGYLNFYNSFYMPLYLYSKKYYDLPQSILLYHGMFEEKDFFKLRYKYTNQLWFNFPDLVYKFYYNARRLSVARHHRVLDKYGKHKRFNYIIKFKNRFQNHFTTNKAERILNKLNDIKLDSYWKDYHNETKPENDKRFLRIKELIETKLDDATSLIELASNQGKFANYLLDNTQLEKIIATDYDKNAVDSIYTNNTSKKNILPLVFDFVRPNGRTNDTKIDQRLKANIVMALAVTHHLILTQDIGLKHVFKVLEVLTNKYVIVEFMPLGLYSGDTENIPPIPDYYTLSWFKKSFSEYFEYILDEEIDINRHIFIGKIKN